MPLIYQRSPTELIRTDSVGASHRSSNNCKFTKLANFRCKLQTESVVTEIVSGVGLLKDRLDSDCSITQRTDSIRRLLKKTFLLDAY